jgi:malonate transporter
MRVLGRFTAQFGVPALLFRQSRVSRWVRCLNGDYLAVYAAGSMTALFVVTLARLACMRGRPVSLAALQGLGASGSNSAFIGYPIVLQVIGPTAGVALALCTLVENLLVMPLALALADSGNGDRRPGAVLQSTLCLLVRNPMILAICAGLTVSALGWHIPAVLDQTVSLAAAAAPPTALFVIGGSLVGLQLSEIRGDIALIAFGKLLLHPLCVLVFVLLFPPEQPLLGAAAILFAAMPMLSIYPVLAQRHGHERLCAAALLAATVSSFVSISLLIALLPPAWLPAH